MISLEYFGWEILTLCTFTFFIGMVVGAYVQHYIEKNHDY